MWLWTFYLILATLFSLTLIYFQRDLADGTHHKQQFQAKQLALGIDTLLISNTPNTTLTLSREDFSYTVKESDVAVTDAYAYTEHYAIDHNKQLSADIHDSTLIITGGPHA